MPVGQSESLLWSRRALLALGASAAVVAQRPPARAETLPSESKRYADLATEFTVVRHTDPTYSSYLTAPYNRGASNRNFLLHSSDRSGNLEAYRLDLKSGASQRLTDAKQLNARSIALLPNDRSFCYVDGLVLKSVTLANSREREIYTAESPFDRVTECGLNPEGTHAYVVELKSSGASRLRMVSLARGTAATIVEADEEIGMPLARPGGGLAYRRGDRICFCERGGAEQLLKLAPGATGPAYWVPDGTALLYLNFPDRPGELNNIRELTIKTGQDKLVAKTTQFVRFAVNWDASVFAGASGSKASPHILILIRSVRRELTICEHRARETGNLGLAFTPNSQRLIFQSDQHGKPAIYSVDVERFVEETES